MDRKPLSIIRNLRRLAPGEPATIGETVSRKTASGLLWIPRSIAEGGPVRDRPVIINYAVTTVGWQMVTGDRAALTAVRERIAQYSIRQALGIVGRITVALAEEDAPSTEGTLGRQRRILASLLGSEAADAIIAQVAAREGDEFEPDRTAFFHERQTLNALKLALIDVPLSQPDAEGISLLPFVEALLMLNDLIEPSGGSMGPDVQGGAEALDLYLAANTAFHEGSALLREFVRAHYLYIQPHPEVRAKNKGVVDLREALRRATGLSADAVWAALSAFHAYWINLDWSDLDAGRIAIDRRQYFSSLPRLSEEERTKWFGLATWDLSDLQDRVRAKYSGDAPRYWDVLPFEERPLIALGDTVFCSSLPLLRRLATSSIQHRFQDQTVFTPKETRDFHGTLGLIAEQYSIECLQRGFGKQYIPESTLEEYAGGKGVCDGVIVYQNALILVEFKSGSPLLTTRHAEDYERYRKSWQQPLQKAAQQFENTIQLIRDGAFESLGVLRTAAREIYPVVGVFQRTVTPIGYRSIRDVDLAGTLLRNMMAAGEVKPIQFLHIKEVEIWEAAVENGQSILELLRQKTASEEMTELSFHHFLDHIDNRIYEQHSAWHARRFAEIQEEVLRYFRTLGMGDEDASGP